jgi:predicted nucleic acid-binding protein
MILLDTNVISEPLKPVPDPRVMAWLDLQIIETFYLPTIALAEILTGIEGMPHGKRRQTAENTARNVFQSLIGPRYLSFDQQAAETHPVLRIKAQQRGVIVSFADCQIAAIASVHNLTVATRDTAPFLAMDVPTINPWEIP